jgi:putative heme iron utilization protein
MPPLITAEQRDRIRTALRNAPAQMTLQLARQLDVPESEIIREMPDGRSLELDLARWQELFEAFEQLGTVTVIVSNGAVTCETRGRFGGFSRWGEFFNVQSDTLDLHIRHARLGCVFAVVKPSHMDGGRTLSFQVFDADGHSALKVFLNFGGRPSAEHEAAFEEMRERFRKRQEG